MGFYTSTLNYFSIINAFSTFASDVYYSGIKIHIIIGPTVPILGFRVVFFACPPRTMLPRGPKNPKGAL